MKILIVGTGGVGGYFGAMLQRAGEDVVFVARGEHLRAMIEGGLRVRSVVPGDFTIRVKAAERPDGSWKADLALFCVKSYSNEEAIEAMRPAVGPDTSILPLQNGIGVGDQLAAAFGKEKVLLGLTYIDAARPEPGVVTVGRGSSRIVFGEWDSKRTPRAVKVLDTLTKAQLDAVLSDDIQRDLWKKLTYICCLSGMLCITRASFVEVLETPETRELAVRVMREAAAVAKALGVSLPPKTVEETLEYFDEHKAEVTSSMFLDLQRGNPIEVGTINGAVSKLGKKAGVPTPVNDLIFWCLTPYARKATARRTTG
ncbi:MAG: ketopantoate reductase family protein [SAR202 cluster bacterium]|nr:ketopantoate reductase family protein [SAR202 cluster bacterium]